MRYLRGCELHVRQAYKSLLDDVGVESQDAELVRTHNAGQELHDEDLVIEGVLLV